jgi:ABC-type transport system substrate-binding protein
MTHRKGALIMKKRLACLLALLLSLPGLPLLAEEYPHDELVVGSTTALSGNFLSEMWGNNTSDFDVRMLLHGYNLIEWKDGLGNYGIDETVVSGIVATDDAQGNRTYTLALYDDLFYSDGTPITARDYAFSILFSIAPEVAQIGGQTKQADAIWGIDAYLSGEASALAGVRILSERQLSITVKAAHLPFFYELALLDCVPYPISVIAPGCEVADEGAGAFIRNINNNEGEAPLFTAALLKETILDPETGYLSHPAVVSGPYTLVRFDQTTGTAAFAINKAYKGNSDGEVPLIPRLVYRTVTNDAMMDLLKSGAVDLLNKCVAADALDAGMQLAGDAAFDMASYPRSGFSFISYCCEREAMSSQAVRQAIAHCLNKDALCADYVGRYGERVDGYYGIGQWMVQAVQSMDSLTIYDPNPAAATSLLEGDGWTLNRAGEPYDPKADAVRCKTIGDALIPLELTLIYPQGNALGEALQAAFVEPLAQVGIALTVKALPTTELLRIYYDNQNRDCDMIYLGSNFSAVFEPSGAFAPGGIANRTAIHDEILYQLAVDMRKTEPGDRPGYCRKWLAFQARFTQVLPSIPIYSNVYYDFYTAALQNYTISSSSTWSQAIVGAYLGDE